MIEIIRNSGNLREHHWQEWKCCSSPFKLLTQVSCSCSPVSNEFLWKWKLYSQSLSLRYRKPSYSVPLPFGFITEDLRMRGRNEWAKWLRKWSNKVLSLVAGVDSIRIRCCIFRAILQQPDNDCYFGTLVQTGYPEESYPSQTVPPVLLLVSL